ncbi:DNA topoisomerase 2 [Massospora cicadina]|nr:DNA topoisomerase 2 [Massospora cicadina]
MQDNERQLINLAFSKEWLCKFSPGTYIDQSADSITHTDSINKLIIYFYMADNIRSISSMVDGLKPGQCKVVYGCFLRPNAEVNVAMLIGSIIKKVAYHHRDQSLVSTIIGLAQNFVGGQQHQPSCPLGQFFSCTQCGKDAGADDMRLFNYLANDGMKVEPEWWSTNILSYNLVEVFYNLRWLMQGEFPSTCCPVHSRITKLNDWHFEIMELPIDWHLNSDMIEDYEKHHSDLGVMYIVWVLEASMAKLEKEDLYTKFKLTDSISTYNLMFFDKKIMTEFYNICLILYLKNKENMVSKLMQEYAKLFNQARFILAFINEELEMCNITHADLIKQLIEMAFDTINTKDDGATNSVFKYLFNMKMISMTRELFEKLFRVCDANFEEIEVLHAKSPLDLWNVNLNLFLKLWEETFEENWLSFAQNLTEGTNCSNKKRWRFASKHNFKKERKETKPKGLACSDRTSKPAAMKLESPSHAKAKLGSPPLAKPLSHSNSTSKPKSKPFQDDSKDYDDQFKGSLSQRTGKKLPSAVKPTPNSIAKTLALDKPESKPKAAPKRKNTKVFDSEEVFEVEAALPTIAKDCPRHQAVPKASYIDTIVLSSEEEEPLEAEMELVS